MAVAECPALRAIYQFTGVVKTVPGCLDGPRRCPNNDHFQPPQPKPMKQDATRWFDAGVFCIFFLLFLHAVEDPDIWFHLAIGRAVWEQGAVPAQEFYLFTRLGQPAEFHEWGFGLAYYLIQQAAGISGMIVANALLGATTLWLLYRAARGSGVSAWSALTATSAGFWLMEFRFVQRPEDFLYLALAATLFFTERYRRSGDWRHLLPIPLVGLLLAQLHPSVLMLGLVLGAYVTEAVARRGAALKQVLPLAATLLATLAISLLNPYGIEQLILPIKFAGETELLADIAEFLPALSTEYAYRFIAGIVLGLLALLGVRRRFSLAQWLMLVAFALLAWQHVRNIALLGLALVLPLATALDGLTAARRQRMPLAVAALLLVAVDALPRHRLAWDIEPTSAPLRGAEIVARETAGGNVLNFYHLGNYLAWRLGGSHRVLIDGRNFRSNPALRLHDSLLLASPGWQGALNRFGIVAVVTPATLPYSGDFIPLAFELANTPGWRLAGREPAGLAFVRDPRRGGGDCATQREVWLQAEEELKENLRTYPDSPASRRSLDITTKRLRSLAGGDCRAGGISGQGS